MFLVVILGFVLTMCNRSASNNKSLNADGTSTVTVSSLPSITLANAGPSAISQTMFCAGSTGTSIRRYYKCDASDDTVFTDYSSYSSSITHDEAFAAGWKLVGSGCSSTNNSDKCFLFHK